MCAVHPWAQAHAVCSRCGNFACLPCTRSTAQAYLCTPCFDGAKTVHLGEASKLQRFFNFVVDVWVVSWALGFMLGIVLTAFGAADLLERPLISWPLMLSVRMLYYTTFEGLSGRTLGKLVTGTKVIAANGDKPAWKQIALRSLVRFVPFDGLSFLGSDYGWHDRWSGTRVVRARGKPRWDASVGTPD